MNIGIIGCGSVAVAHINALQKLKTIKKIYVYDVDSSKSHTFSQKFTSLIATVSLAQMILDVDGAIITTPNNTHLCVLKNILSIKSIPVLCEKPLSSSLTDATEFNRLAPPLSRIGLNYRFNQIISDLLTLVQTQKLGKFIFVDIAFNKNSALTKSDITWRDNKDQSKSSGAFGDLSSHLFDLVQYITNSSIIQDTLSISLGTKVPFRGMVKLINDDHSIATGLTDNGICFKVKATKSALEHDLGFHINLILENGELYYSSNYPNNIKVHYTNSLEIDNVTIQHKKVIEDPDKEIPYWSDSFYLQDKEWTDLICKKTTSKKLANISDGLKIQKLISSIQ